MIIDWGPAVTAISYVTILYVLYVLYKELDRVGMLKPLHQLYWLTIQRLWEEKEKRKKP